jgi:hypothetical protein
MLTVALIPLNALRIRLGLDFPNLQRRLSTAGVIVLGLSFLLTAAFASLRLGVDKITRAVAAVLLTADSSGPHSPSASGI